MAKKQVLKKRKPAAQEGDEAGGEQQKKKRMWWEDELDGQRRSARDGPEENAAYFREEVRHPCREACSNRLVPCLLVRVLWHRHLRKLSCKSQPCHMSKQDRVQDCSGRLLQWS